jgi:hypothetical protein
MAGVRRAIRVLPGDVSNPARRQPPLAAGYEHFRLERQGALLSAKTLDYYDGMVLPFFKWLDAEGVRRFDHLDVSHVRLYRAQLAVRPGRWGRTLAPKTLLESHRAILCFSRLLSDLAITCSPVTGPIPQKRQGSGIGLNDHHWRPHVQ